MNNEALKIAALVGGLVFIAFQLIFNFGEAFDWLKLGLAFVLFLVVAGATYGVMKSRG